jgi:hypothetical protein
MQIGLSEMTERHAKEKKRRQELHNLLMVRVSHNLLMVRVYWLIRHGKCKQLCYVHVEWKTPSSSQSKQYYLLHTLHTLGLDFLLAMKEH